MVQKIHETAEFPNNRLKPKIIRNTAIKYKININKDFSRIIDSRKCYRMTPKHFYKLFPVFFMLSYTEIIGLHRKGEGYFPKFEIPNKTCHDVS